MPRGKKSKEAPATLTLVRRHIKTGEISPRKRGRLGPDFEKGHTNGDGVFQTGNPETIRRKRRGPGRPPKGTRAQRDDGISGEIERLVNQEVGLRLRAAKDAAIQAISTSLGM